MEIPRKREEHTEPSLPKGVILIDGVSAPDLRRAIKENKILLGTKEELQKACEQIGLALPGKAPRDAGPNDAWAFNASREGYRAAYYQTSILFIDSDQHAALIDLATPEDGFSGLHGALEQVGFVNQQTPEKQANADYFLSGSFDKLTALRNIMTEKI